MASKICKKFKKFIGIKRKIIPENQTNLKIKKQLKRKENEIIRMTYKLEKNLFRHNVNIKLFGADFVKRNENKFSIIIAGIKKEIVSMVDIKEFEKNGVNVKKFK